MKTQSGVFLLLCMYAVSDIYYVHVKNLNCVIPYDTAMMLMSMIIMMIIKIIISGGRYH